MARHRGRTGSSFGPSASTRRYREKQRKANRKTLDTVFKIPEIMLKLK